MTFRAWRERHLLRAIVSRCEGSHGVFGPLWEPRRPQPQVDISYALDALLGIESYLAELLREESRILSRYLLGAGVLSLASAVVIVLLGAPFKESFLLFGSIWALVALLWLWGYPIEAEGYWFSPRSKVFPNAMRLPTYRSVFEQLFDSWVGVDQSMAAELRRRLSEADARRVLIVVDTAWSLRSSSRRSHAV